MIDLINNKNKFKTVVSQLLIIAASMSTAWAMDMAESTSIEVSDLYVNSTPPTADVTAAYMTLTNHTGQTVTLTGATSTLAGAVELHRTSVEGNGMMKMQRVDNPEIPPHGELRFAPGGLHMMLTHLNRALNPGDHVPITLMFVGRENLTLDAEVHDVNDEDMGHMDHMDHMDHDGHHH